MADSEKLVTCPRCRRPKRRRGEKLSERCATAEAEGRRNTYEQLSVEKYETMFNAFSEQQSVSYAARTAGVHQRTAIRYIEGPADPSRGMEPIRKRFQAAMRKAMKRADYGLEKAMESSLELMKTAKYTLSKQLIRDNFELTKKGEIQKDATGSPVIRSNARGVQDVYGAIARITQAELALLDRMNGPGARPPDLFDGWTKEEAELFIMKNVWPDRIVARLRLTRMRAVSEE